MPRTDPRPYTKWAAIDAIKAVDAIKNLHIQLIRGLIQGDRDDQIAEYILQADQLLSSLRDRLITFRDGPNIEQLVDWIMGDETLLCLIVHRLEGTDSR